MQYARRIDTNQVEIVETLRKLGFSVVVNHDDILVGRDGVTLWVEIKSKDGRVTKSQEQLLDQYQGAYIVARNFQEITNWFMYGQTTVPD